MSFTANTRIANNVALHYGAAVTSHNIMQQHKLAACVCEYVMASTSDIRLSSLVVCIMGSYEGGLSFKFDTDPDLLNVDFALFFKISNQVPEMEARKFSSLFFCLITI